jgi:AcrR family transcriptional regulator
VDDRPSGGAARRAAHRPSRRHEVVDAAIEVFAERGIAASVADIAAATGMSQASIYYHFGSKEELFTTAVRAVSRRVIDTTRQYESREHKLLTRDAVAIVWSWAEQHRNEARLLYVWALGGPPEAQQVRREFIEHYVRRVRRRIPRPEPATKIDLAVERLAARSYMALAMGVSELWADGVPIAGTLDRERISAALAVVSEQLTSAP